MVSEAMVKSNKRKSKYSKGGKTKKAANVLAHHMEGKVKMDRKMKKMFRKRARDYNSDDNDDDNELQNTNVKRRSFENEVLDGNSSGEDEANASHDEEEMSGSEEEGHESQSGITKFIGGCRAFSIAFKTITKKNISDDLLGPVLSEHKKLVAEKLAEEAELKVKGEARKERPLLREKGHVKPANFLDSHEKFLISVATKGVVKLFNAVNKAQNAQKGLNPSRSKDAKVLAKRRKEAFLTELHKKPTQAAEILSKGINLGGTENDDGPSWAPLRDSYMLTSSKLKNWDKMQETNVAPAMEEMPHYSSSDED